MLAYVCETLNKREHTLILDSYMIATLYAGTRISPKNIAKAQRKIRERAAKDAMIQVHQSPFEVSMLEATLLWWKPDVSFLLFSCPLPLYSFPPPQVGEWGVWRDGGQTHCQCMPMPDLIFLTWLQAFLLSPRKVRERGCCSMDCTKATVVAAKVKRKDSRRTLVSTMS